MDDYWALLQIWLPFLILIGCWLLLTRGTRQQSSLGIELMREAIELQKKTNSCLEEIKAELKSR
jgi:hypothetical protein